MLLLLNLLLLQGVLLPLVVSQDGPVVSTKYGQVEGMSLVTGDGNPYDEFRGIPFAAPPEGMLRWEKPVEPAPWDGVLPAKEFGRICPQLVLPWAREDCLSVNVYVPDSVEEHVDDPLPVMVWVYGGAFFLGFSSMYNGKLVATRGRVVMVNFNYRVGTGGFLSTQSDAAPGNYGLWDQVAALRWVQENIAAFGGDANRVTIIGQSAGGASVSHVALAPEARGLFHRVIALSGSASSLFAVTTREALTTRNLARHYECPEDNDEAMVDCLRGQSAFSLAIDGLLVPLTEHGYIPNHVPVIDGELVTMDPLEAMEQGLNADYDFLAGRGRDDGSMFSLSLSGTTELFRNSLLLVFTGWANKEELTDMVFEQYPDLSSEDALLRDQAACQVITDLFFGCGVYQEVGYHSQNAASTGKSTYFYEFDYSYLTKDSWVSGMHVEDVIMFFGDGIIFSFDDEDKIVSKNLQSYYCNFAYTGNPNEGPHDVPTEWPQYDTTNKMQMRQALDMTSETLSEDVIARYNWWNEVFYPAAIPEDGSSSPQINRSDFTEVRKKFAQIIEKFAQLNPADPLVLQASARAIKETTEMA